MASADTSDQTRPEKLEHPNFWARQRARMGTVKLRYLMFM